MTNAKTDNDLFKFPPPFTETAFVGGRQGMNEQERELVSLMIGYQIRNSRRVRSLSQGELAQGIGSQSMISLLESGRQFPLPDVLALIAERLSDSVLHAYANLLASGQWSLTDFASTNREVLLEVLRTHRGKWHDVHTKVAIELCDYFYVNRIFRTVCEICQLLLHHANDPVVQAKAHFYLGSAELFEHQYKEAELRLRQAEKLSILLDDALRSRLHYNLGYVYSVLDYYGLSMWYAKLAVDEFHRVHDYPRHAKALGLLGVIQCRLGHFEEARETLQLASELCDKWGMSDADQSRIYISLADVYESLNQSDLAETWSLRAISSSSAVSDFVTSSAGYRILCLVYMSTGEPSRAVSALESSIADAEHSRDGWSLAHAYLLATGVYQAVEERVDAARRAFHAAQTSNSTLLQALAADCLSNLIRDQDQTVSESFRLVALQSYREYLDRSTRFSSEFRYLPLTESSL
jgi:transcriptional regulator with XRE-family HTH domain